MLCVSTRLALCFMHLSWVQNRIFHPKNAAYSSFLRKMQTGNVPHNIQSAVLHTISQTDYPTKAESERWDTSLVWPSRDKNRINAADCKLKVCPICTFLRKAQQTFLWAKKTVKKPLSESRHFEYSSPHWCTM